jgi:hypothetical protein
MTSKYARLGISLSIFFSSLYSHTVTPIIHISITMRVIVIATVRDDSWDEVVLSR